jgi:hypothetical protein
MLRWHFAQKHSAQFVKKTTPLLFKNSIGYSAPERSSSVGRKLADALCYT